MAFTWPRHFAVELATHGRGFHRLHGLRLAQIDLGDLLRGHGGGGALCTDHDDDVGVGHAASTCQHGETSCELQSMHVDHEFPRQNMKSMANPATFTGLWNPGWTLANS